MNHQPGTAFYEATFYSNDDSLHVPFVTEYATEAEARAVVEANGAGRVVEWYPERNLPRALPEIVCRSCAMAVYENGAWRNVNIFG